MAHVAWELDTLNLTVSASVVKCSCLQVNSTQFEQAYGVWECLCSLEKCLNEDFESFEL